MPLSFLKSYFQKQNYLQILKLKQNSNSHKANLIPFIHFITHINNAPITTKDLKITSKVELTIFDTRLQKEFKIEIEPPLGLSVKLTNELFVLSFCVLKVYADSPAFFGLIENQDFIIGIEGEHIVDEDDFFNFVYKQKNKKIILVVFNIGMLNVRRVEVQLSDEGENLLGCELGSGILYELPNEGEIYFEFDDIRNKDYKVKNGYVTRESLPSEGAKTEYDSGYANENTQLFENNTVEENKINADEDSKNTHNAENISSVGNNNYRVENNSVKECIQHKIENNISNGLQTNIAGDITKNNINENAQLGTNHCKNDNLTNLNENVANQQIHNNIKNIKSEKNNNSEFHSHENIIFDNNSVQHMQVTNNVFNNGINNFAKDVKDLNVSSDQIKRDNLVSLDNNLKDKKVNDHDSKLKASNINDFVVIDQLTNKNESTISNVINNYKDGNLLKNNDFENKQKAEDVLFNSKNYYFEEEKMNVECVKNNKESESNILNDKINCSEKNEAPFTSMILNDNKKNESKAFDYKNNEINNGEAHSEKNEVANSDYKNDNVLQEETSTEKNESENSYLTNKGVIEDGLLNIKNMLAVDEETVTINKNTYEYEKEALMRKLLFEDGLLDENELVCIEKNEKIYTAETTDDTDSNINIHGTFEPAFIDSQINSSTFLNDNEDQNEFMAPQQDSLFDNKINQSDNLNVGAVHDFLSDELNTLNCSENNFIENLIQDNDDEFVFENEEIIVENQTSSKLFNENNIPIDDNHDFANQQSYATNNNNEQCNETNNNTIFNNNNFIAEKQNYTDDIVISETQNYENNHSQICDENNDVDSNMYKTCLSNGSEMAKDYDFDLQPAENTNLIKNLEYCTLNNINESSSVTVKNDTVSILNQEDGIFEDDLKSYDSAVHSDEGPEKDEIDDSERTASDPGCL